MQANLSISSKYQLFPSPARGNPMQANLSISAKYQLFPSPARGKLMQANLSISAGKRSGLNTRFPVDKQTEQCYDSIRSIIKGGSTDGGRTGKL